MYNTQAANQNQMQNYNNRMDYFGAAAEGLGDVGYEARNREILPKIFGYDSMARFIKPEYLKNSNEKSYGGKLR